MIEKYLLAMITILILTQIIRLIQNTIHLKRNYVIMQKQLEGLDDISQHDIDIQRKAHMLMVEYLESKLRGDVK